jgi:predicted MFS family arabinose efflux permease
MTGPDDGKKYWLDQPGNVRLLLRVLAGFGALLFVADFLYHKHIHFEAERVFGFYALFGFAAFVGIVLAGKQLRKLLMRPEDYYDD